MNTQQVIEITGQDDFAYDPWGSAMAVFFAIADVLNMSDIEGDVTPEPFARWQYSPSPYVAIPDVDTVAARADDFAEGEWADDFDYSTVALAVAYRDGEVTQDDLIRAGDVLSRYTQLLERAGRSY